MNSLPDVRRERGSEMQIRKVGATPQQKTEQFGCWGQPCTLSQVGVGDPPTFCCLSGKTLAHSPFLSFPLLPALTDQSVLVQSHHSLQNRN